MKHLGSRYSTLSVSPQPGTLVSTPATFLPAILGPSHSSLSH